MPIGLNLCCAPSAALYSHDSQVIHVHNMQLRGPEKLKPSKKQEAINNDTLALIPGATVERDSGKSASNTRERSYSMDDDLRVSSGEEKDNEDVPDSFQLYREALHGVLPAQHCFRVRRIDSYGYYDGKRLPCGEVLIGRQIDIGSRVWACLQGEHGQRVVYRDDRGASFLLPLALNDTLDFEHVFQLLFDSSDRFASRPLTRTKIWKDRVGLVVRLVLRDFKFYAPTVMITDPDFKMDDLLETIRHNATTPAEKNSIDNEPIPEQSSRLIVKDIAEGYGTNTEQEMQSLDERAKYQTFRKVHIPATSSHEHQQHSQHDILDNARASSAPYGSGTGPSLIPDPVQPRKKQKLTTTPAGKEGTMADRNSGTSPEGDVDMMNSHLIQNSTPPERESEPQEVETVARSTHVTKVRRTSYQQSAVDTVQSTKKQNAPTNRQKTLKEFAEQKLNEARQQEKAIALRQITGLQLRMDDLQKLVTTQEDKLKAHTAENEKLEVLTSQQAVCKAPTLAIQMKR